MRVGIETMVQLMTDEELDEFAAELGSLRQRLDVKLAFLLARISRPAIETPPWFEELL